MEQIYFILTLAIMVSSLVTGFIVFRMQGMSLAPHFGMLILALIATLIGLFTNIPLIYYLAAALQLITVLTGYTQMFKVLTYNFQTAPSYAPHLALITMLPVLVLAGIFI